MEWQTPPPKPAAAKPKRFAYKAEAEELAANPGEWALIASGVERAEAGVLRLEFNRGNTTLDRIGKFGSRIVRDDGAGKPWVFDLYAYCSLPGKVVT